MSMLGYLGNNPYVQQQMNAQAPQAMNPMQGGNFSLSNIFQQLQGSQNQANQANQQRYQDILGLYSGLGQAGAQQITNQTAQQQAASTQNLQNRGLGNTTVTGAMSQGIAAQGQQEQQALAEQVAQMQGGVMERMTQQGPNLGQYGNLIAGMMSRGGGQQQQGGWRPMNQPGTNFFGGAPQTGGGWASGAL